MLNSFDREEDLPTGVVAPGPYHSALKPGHAVHETRPAANLALALLRRGQPADLALANRILLRLAQLQDTRPTSPTFGIWPYYLEEPCDQMDVPDHNWADFIGARLCHVLIEHPDRLPPETRQVLRRALELAATAIVRRDVSADYTNIAIMGGCVTACAGQITHRPDWLAFARTKLAGVEQSVQRHGSFPEYNSPTYTLVALEECSRVLQLCRDEAARATAGRLAGVAWTCIANHWHVRTGQWAGPHARAYNDLLPTAERERILAAAEGLDGIDGAGAVALLPCPADLRPHFFRQLSAPAQRVEQCEAASDTAPARIATTYLDADFCVGSLSRSHYWHQSRGLIAHVATTDGVCVVRPRLLLDGQDFARGGTFQAQEGPHILSAARFWSGSGSFHPIFHASPDGAFEARRLVLRLQFFMPPARIVSPAPDLFTATLGPMHVHLHCPPAIFFGRSCPWAPAAPDDRTGAIECVLYDGPRQRLALVDSPARIAFGLEFSREESPALPALDFAQAGGDWIVSWATPARPLTLRIPQRGGARQW
jgi:hypothetical protein